MALLAGFDVLPSSDGSGLSGGSASPGRDFFQYSSAVTSDGTFSTIDIRMEESASSGNIKIKVWRRVSSDLVFIGESTLPALSSGLNSDVVLDSPLSVLSGDIISIFIVANNGRLARAAGAADATKWSGVAADYTATIAENTLSSDIAYSVLFSARGTASASGSPEILIESPSEQDRYKQRNLSNQYSYTVSGSASNLPANTVVRYSLDGGAYQTLDASPSDTFSGTVTVTSTQSVTIDIYDGTTSYSSKTITLRAVAWVLGDGQSNMASRGFNNQSLTLETGAQTPVALKGSTFGIASDPMGIDSQAAGSWQMEFLSLLANANKSITYGFVNVAEGGTSVNRWIKSASDLYPRITSAFALTGGFEYAITLLGETDASNSMPQAEAETKYGSFIDDKKTDFGVNTYLVNFPKLDYAGNDDIRAAFASLVAGNASCFDGGDLRPLDIANTGGDGVHLQTDAQLSGAANIIYSAISEILRISKNGLCQSYPYNTNGTEVNCQVTFTIDAVDNVQRSLNGGVFTTIISNATIGEHTDTIALTAGVYSVTYRMASNTSASDTHTLAVGYCLGVGGHSNVSGRGDNNQIVVPSTSGVTAYIFKNNDQFAVLTDPSDSSSGQVDSITDDGSLPGGSMLPHVANIWLEQNPDIPIIFNVNAKGGSQLSFWMKDSTEVADGLNRYDSLSRRVTKAGGINDLLFFIGGNDTLENRASYTQEKANLIQFASDIKADFGANTLLIPLPDYTDKVNRPIGDVVYGQDAIRMALQDAALESNNIYVTESIYAVGVGSDGVHSTSDQQLTDLGRITGRSLWNLDTQCTVSIPELDSSDGVFTVVGTSSSTEVLNERMFLTGGTGGTPAFNLDAGDPIELVLDNGTDTYTVSGQIGGTLAVATANTPPTANAGTNQSVAAGVTVQLDASSSTPGANAIALYEWTQTAGDTVALEDETTATPSFSAPSTTIAQTITFSVVAIDTEENRSAAATVSIDVAAVVLSEVLKIIERLDFELQTQGDVNAYYGRANREVMKLKPSSTEGLVMDGEFLNLESNTITEVKIVAEGVSISSKTDAININKSELIPRLGDLDIGKNGNIYFSIIVFVEGDDKGVVVSSKGATGNKPMIYVTL